MNKVVVNYLWQNVAHLRGIWKMLSKLFWYFSQNYLAALRPSYSANIMVQIFRVYCELIYTYLHGSNSGQNLSFLLFCCPKASFGPLLRRQPHHLMFITVFFHIWPEGHRKPCSEVGSLSPAECLVWTRNLPILITMS